jgi:hypothetical protein
MKKIIVMIILVSFTFFNLCGSSSAALSSNVNKKGWKYLTWGMSIDETNTLLVKNGMKEMFFRIPRDSSQFNRIELEGALEYFQSEIIKCGESDYVGESNNSFDFYFINEKLAAVKISYKEKDNDCVIDQLKKNYPSGKIKKGTYVDFKWFSYVDNNIIVHTTNSGGEGDYVYIWYINPEVKKIKKNIKTLEKQRIKKETEDRTKKIF